MEIEKNYSQEETKVLLKDKAVSKSFMANVFMWMFVGLLLTALTAWVVVNSGFITLLFHENGLNLLGWVTMLSPFIMVIFMSYGLNKMSFPMLMGLFLFYSVLMGASLSFILLVYTAQSIFTTFLIAAGMFGAMAIAGYTTKIDLSKFGSIMIMGLVGLIIATVVNIFLKSGTLYWLISCGGVLIFTGLTAWDVQRMKKVSESDVVGTETGNKFAIMGALSLYLNFINLFLFLLRLLGRD